LFSTVYAGHLFWAHEHRVRGSRERKEDKMFWEVHTRAKEHGEVAHPKANAAHHGAFANSVAYAVTGFSGGSGPSMREHWCTRLFLQAGTPGGFTFDEGISICEEVCYGPLTVEIASMQLHESCIGDSAEDTEEAERLLQG
jgi:hypothetical protein